MLPVCQPHLEYVQCFVNSRAHINSEACELSACVEILLNASCSEKHFGKNKSHHVRYGKINAVLSRDMRLLVSPLNITFVDKIPPIGMCIINFLLELRNPVLEPHLADL